MLWGLAWDGEAGARWVLDTLRTELELDLMLLGAPSPAHVARHHVR
jgi:(S)-2-hydroxy-acid oxidase/4-hydroxymandelate oxidase